MSFVFIVHFLAVFLRGIDAAVFILCALLFVCDWIKRRFYVPAYIHVMATITFVGSWVLLRGMTYCCPPESPPPSKWVYAGTALFLAVVVYVVFVFYGGASAAWNTKQDQAKNL